MNVILHLNDDETSSLRKNVPVLKKNDSVPQSTVHQNHFLRKKLIDMNEENELLKRRNKFIMSANDNYYRNLRQLKTSDKLASAINKEFIGCSCNGNMTVLQTFYKSALPIIKKRLANADDNFKRIGRAIKRLAANTLNYKNGIKMGDKGYINLASGKLNYKGLHGLDLINALLRKLRKERSND